MAHTKTALDPTFLGHQFQAGPWLRLFLIPVALGFIVGGAWVGTWITVIGGALVGTSTLITVLYPERDVFRAFGMSAARARQQLLIITVPIVLFTVAMYATFVPRPVIAATGSLVSVAIGVILVSDHGAVGDKTQARDQNGSTIKKRGTLPFQAMWRQNLIWAAVSGLALAVTVAVSGQISNDTVSGIVAAAPVLAFFGMFGQQVFEGGNSPLVAKSFGFPRRLWAAHVLGVSVVSGLLIGALGGGVAMLIEQHNADLAWHPFIVIAAAVAGFCVFTAGAAVKGTAFSWIVAFLLWFGINDVMRLEEATITGPLSIGVLVVSALIALIGAVCIALYAAGRTNVTPSNMQRIAGLKNAR